MSLHAAVQENRCFRFGAMNARPVQCHKPQQCVNITKPQTASKNKKHQTLITSRDDPR